MLDFFKKIFKKKKKNKIRKININIDEWVRCRSCQYDGPMSSFLEDDHGDLRCPYCGEEEAFIFQL